MKLFKTIQEDGVFGVAATLENSIRSAREYQKLRRELCQKGLTDYQIDMIRNSVVRQLFNIDGSSVPKYCLGDQFRRESDYDHEIEAIKNLRKHGFIWTDRHQDYWFLTKTGLIVRKDLEYHKPIEKTIPVVYGGQQNNLPVHASTVDSQMDISLARDGLLTTCSKLWYVWTNKDEILEKAQAKQYLEFLQGHAEIEEAQKMIATSEQRVATKLASQTPVPYVSAWTEEEQRHLNDIYWMGDGIAFWLNPRGMLADPTPAPEWWTPPANYKSVSAPVIEAALNDVVERSLLAPPKSEDITYEHAEVLWVKATPEEIAAKYADKELDLLFEDLHQYRPDEVTDNQLRLAALYSHFALIKESNHVVPLQGDRETNEFALKMEAQNEAITIAGRGTRTYGDLLRMFEKQTSGAMDQIIKDLDALEDDTKTSEYDEWLERIEQLEKQTAPKSFSERYIKKQLGAEGVLYTVSYDGSVRGFPSMLEAETWLGERRTEMKRRVTGQVEDADKAAIHSSNQQRIEEARKLRRDKTLRQLKHTRRKDSGGTK